MTLPAFILIVMLGTFPAGEVIVTPHPDRDACASAANVVWAVTRNTEIVKTICYDTRLGMAVSMYSRGRAD